MERNSESIDAQLSRLSREVFALRELLAPAGSRPPIRPAEVTGLGQGHDRLIEQNRQLIADNHRIRKTLAQMGHRLAEVETLANSRIGEADALRTELAALRAEHAECQATLARFRGSVSWAVTRPLRFTGRTFKKIIRRGAK